VPLERDEKCHNRLMELMCVRPVTAEAAGSSPVSRAILANRIRHLSNPRFRDSAAVVAAFDSGHSLIGISWMC
jgi:hypothetical protein